MFSKKKIYNGVRLPRAANIQKDKVLVVSCISRIMDRSSLLVENGSIVRDLQFRNNLMIVAPNQFDVEENILFRFLLKIFNLS